MKELQPDLQGNIQINLGSAQRNAARDYNEYFIPGSIKLVLRHMDAGKAKQYGAG